MKILGDYCVDRPTCSVLKRGGAKIAEEGGYGWNSLRPQLLCVLTSFSAAQILSQIEIRPVLAEAVDDSIQTIHQLDFMKILGDRCVDRPTCSVLKRGGAKIAEGGGYGWNSLRPQRLCVLTSFSATQILSQIEIRPVLAEAVDDSIQTIHQLDFKKNLGIVALIERHARF